MSLFDLKLGELRDRTASDAPTPGGGSVACVSSTLGLALVIMAVEITAKNKPSAPLSAWLEEARALLSELSLHADRDVAAFDGYMRAYALPRRTDEEKEERRGAMSEAAVNCTVTPLTAAADMVEALRRAREIAPSVKRSVQSDVLAGTDLLVGSVEALLRSVDVNLPAIPDPESSAMFATVRARTAAEARALRDEIIEIASRVS